jgi:uncharacterized protein YndB with AHSA1/START domain
METLNFSIKINAPKEKVWDVLLGKKTYPEWTSVFAPGSEAETDWKEGSRALFTDGKGNGMISRIAKNIPNEFISIEHLGMIENGVEDLTSDKVKAWAGAHENYTLKESGGGSELVVDMDTDKEYKDYFTKTWPVALDKVKAIAESN